MFLCTVKLFLFVNNFVVVAAPPQSPPLLEEGDELSESLSQLTFGTQSCTINTSSSNSYHGHSLTDNCLTQYPHTDDETKTFEESGTQTLRDSNNSSSTNAESDDTDEPITDGRRITGQVKWFNVKKGWGFIIGEHGEDIFVHQSGVNKAGFRSLDDGEMVEYEIRNTDKGPEACKITGPAGSSVLGSQRRKRMRILQKQRKNRCFNCNVEGHIASSCPIPNSTKRCHVCLKDDHLMRQCPHQPLLLQQESGAAGLMGTSPPNVSTLSGLAQITPPPPPPHLRAPIVTSQAATMSPLTMPPTPSASLISQMQLQAQLQLMQPTQLSPLLQTQQLLQSQQLSATAPQLYYTLATNPGQPFLYTYVPRFPSGPPI